MPVSEGYDFPDFDVEGLSLKRRRAILEALQKRNVAPAAEMVSGHYVAPGWLGAAGDLLSAALYNRQSGKLDTEERDLAGRQNQALTQALANFPQGTPGQPAIEQPPAELGGGPGAPEVPAQQPTQQQYLQSSRELTNIGGPMGVAAGRRALEMALPNPKDKYLSVPGGGVVDTSTGKWMEQSPAQKQEAESRQEERLDRLRVQREALEAKIAEAQLKRESDAELKRELMQNRLEVARMIHASSGANQPGSLSLGGTDISGDQVYLHSKQGMVKMDPQSRTLVPFTGKLVRPGEEKTVQGASDLLNQASYADSLIDKVLKNPKIYETQANVGNIASNITMGFGEKAMTGLTDEELELRGSVARVFAAITKDLYGANYTKSEQARAQAFTPRPGEDATTIAQKLKGAAEFQREMAKKVGSKALGAAEARSGGNKVPAAGEVRDGYRFKGGDPAKQENWEKV